MRGLAPMLLVLASLLVVGCGGAGDTKTVVQTVVRTAPATLPPTAPPATTPTDTTTVDAAPAVPGQSTQDPPPGAPLPGGVATVQGRYRVVYKDYSPPSYNLGGTYTGDKEQWNADTSCRGGRCAVQLRRSLQTGGFKNYALRSSSDKKYTGTFTAKADACGSDPPATVLERVSIQTSEIEKLGSVPTATGLDIYIKQTGTCRESGDKISATGTWKASRIGP